ncbi:NACHT, LRR and PYD domains-containing protein 5 [Chionoecetes opilio]|uniref:NACHT, LRR and PYD domains-containing protein 5 n=1 Tax=Chionoecetes opilio TaxID=41210 RepID=A0A8J5CDG8_CHIOP|nr:NACHT, LRR and PYD domains-containing protein 5 [Chionoecetes opilio]
MTVAELCRRNNAPPTLGPVYRPLLHCNIMEHDFDVCFGYELLTKVCVSLYGTLSEKCKASIRKLCELATEVMLGHAEGWVDSALLLRSFRLTLEAVYKGISQAFHEEFYDKLHVMEQDIDNILGSEDSITEECKLKEDDLEKYRTLRMAVKGYQELEGHYETLWNLNPFEWEEKVSHSGLERSDTSYFHLENIFTEPEIRNGTQTVPLNKLLQQADVKKEAHVLPAVLLLHGLAGSGKTALCRYLIYYWLKGGTEVSLRTTALVLLIDVPRVRSSRLKEFLLDQLLPVTCAGLDADHIISTLKELNVMFLIDGYDETNRVSSDLVDEIFAKFGDKRILVTTRPELHKDVVCLTRRYNKALVSLEIRGFDDKKREEFCKKIFSSLNVDEMVCKHQTNEFLKYSRGQSEVLHQYLNLPLTCALVVFLWTHCLDTLTATTGLYQEIYCLLQARLAERLSRDFIGVCDLPVILDTLLLFLGEQAWTMLREGSAVASEAICAKLEGECKAKGIKVQELLSGFHLCHLDENPDVWKLRVAFQHPIHARYLAATFLADCIHKSRMTVLGIGGQIDSCPKIEELLLFLTGSEVLPLTSRVSWSPMTCQASFHALEAVGQHIRKRQRKLIKVDLYLWRHESYGHDGTSGDILKALNHWGNLTTFVGGLGKQAEGEDLLTGFTNLRTIRVKISTSGAFRSLSNTLRKIQKSVKSLTVTLTLPLDSLPEELTELKHNGTLDINLVGMTDARREWVVNVVRTVGGRTGCWRLRLAECRMNYDALEWVVRELKGHVRNEVDIESVS